MGLAAIICAVSNVPTSGKVHGEAYWKGRKRVCPYTSLQFFSPHSNFFPGKN